jgi:NAD dependent epimerase/dehydratase family
MINTEEQLEDALSRPTAADIAAARELAGDLLILGVGGKMGPSLARLARRALHAAGSPHRVIAVARFSNPQLRGELDSDGIETIVCDLLDPGALSHLPDAPDVIFMAAKKFGTTGAEHSTWAMNTFLPGLVAERYRTARIVAFSTGNVYPLVTIASGGATEDTPVAPVGEYAQSALGRERMFAYGSAQWGTQAVLLRLNYAVELRYGVLVDIAWTVYNRCAVDLKMGMVNVLWQRDANSVCLRSFAHCQAPPLVLNVTGPEMLSVRYIAEQVGRRFAIEPIFATEESSTALLSNSARAIPLFGYPTVAPMELLDWIADWIRRGGRLLNKATGFSLSLCCSLQWTRSEDRVSAILS